MRASFLSVLAVFIVRIYQNFISPFLGKNCRFHPTCSEYYIQAVRTYGFFRGSILGVKRIIKCGPWNPGGFDPVP